MTIEDDTTNVDIEESLEDFEAEFYRTSDPEKSADDGRENQEEAEETEKVIAEIEDNPLATDDDEEEDESEEEEDEDDEEVEEVPQIKQKRNRAQERIEKLVAEARQAERERDALRIELERLRAETEVKQKDEAPTLREQLPAEAPNPDAKDDKGEPLYELGEFDPKYIRDLTKFTIEQETKAARERAAEEARQKAIAEEQQRVQAHYLEKLEKAEEELPDIREKIRDLTDTFQTIEPAYGEYLATTLMASEVGPQIMYYLSQNIGEAQKIVASGPAAATLALGRLEAKFLTSPPQEEKRNTKQVSQAPEPPENIERARGRGGRFVVAPDTDDLNAFEREFFK